VRVSSLADAQFGGPAQLEAGPRTWREGFAALKKRIQPKRKERLTVYRTG